MRYRLTRDEWASDWIDVPESRKIGIGHDMSIELEQEYVKFEMAGVTGKQCQSTHVFVGGHTFRCSLREGHHGHLHTWDSSDMSETLSWKDSK